MKHLKLAYCLLGISIAFVLKIVAFCLLMTN